MLMDSLSRSIKKMKQMLIVENAVLDAERKAKNDSDYRTVVDDFSNTLNRLQQAVTIMDYMITSEIALSLEESLDKLNEVVVVGVVDADNLLSAQQHIKRKVTPNLTKEWKAYHQEKSKVCISKLDTLGNLAGSPDMVASIKDNISKGSEWAGLLLSDDGVNTRLSLFKSSVDKIDELEDNLNLSDEIKAFISKVTSKTAKVSDISDNIREWIEKENLDDKFVIKFKS